MKVGDAAILIDAERIKVVAEICRRHVLWIEVNARAIDAKDSVSDRLAKIVC